MPLVRDIHQDDYKAWRKLWDGYTAFYNEKLPEQVTQSTWNRMFDPESSIQAHVAEEGGSLVGFAIFLMHEATWQAEPICYLEDLYVDETIRGKGVGRALIQNLIDLGHQKGWGRVYWHTDKANERARRLYDQFLPADNHVRYRVYMDK